MTKVLALALLALPALLLTLAGCNLLPLPTAPPQGDVAARALFQRGVWRSNGIDSYRFTVSRPCFCPTEWSGPFEVEVEDGQVVSVTRDGGVVGAEQAGSIPRTIEAVFEVVLENTTASKIEVTYDATFGFPSQVSVDPIANAADEEFGITVMGFEPTG